MTTPEHEPEPLIGSEREQLELQELRLRNRDLSLEWWKRPAVTAPIATIVAAVLGLIWAASTGFFDVTRRELAVSKRELQIQTADLEAKRDRQTAAFNAESRKLRSQIEQLTRRQAELVQELETLDIPVLVHAQLQFRGAYPMSPDSIELTVTGTNFGSTEGTAKIPLSVSCPTTGKLSELGIVPAVIDEWSPNAATLVVKLHELKRMTETAMPDGLTSATCSTRIGILIKRADGAQSSAYLLVMLPGSL